MPSSSLVQLAMLLDLQQLFTESGSSLWGNQLFQAASDLAAGTPEISTLPTRTHHTHHGFHIRNVGGFELVRAWYSPPCLCSLHYGLPSKSILISGQVGGFCAACILNPERHFLDSSFLVSKAHGTAQRHHSLR